MEKWETRSVFQGSLIAVFSTAASSSELRWGAIVQSRVRTVVVVVSSPEVQLAASVDQVARVLRTSLRVRNQLAFILSELVMEQTWSIFKIEADRFATQKKRAHGYVDALHDIWNLMRKFGVREGNRERSTGIWYS